MRRLVGSLATVVAVVALTAGTALAANGQPFKSSGSGTETSLSASGCQFTLAGCTVQTNGTATSSHVGTGPYVSTLTIDWAQATSNGEGGFCAPASGNSQLSDDSGNTLYLQDTGTVCEVGATGSNVPHTFTGTYMIDPNQSTGRFTGDTGSGTINGSDDGSGNSSYTTSGSIDL